MKNNKPYKSGRSKRQFGSSPSFSKSRDGDTEGRKSYSGSRSKDSRFGDKPRSGERTSFGDKPRFGDKGKPRFGSSSFSKSRDGDTEDRKSYSGSRGKDSRFGDKPRSGERTSFGDKPRSGERTSFGDKPRFANKGKDSFRKDFKSKPDFRKPKRENRAEEKYVPDGVLIWGLHAVRAAFLNSNRRITRLWLSEAGQKLLETTQEEAKAALLRRPDAKMVDREELERITPHGSVHQGIVIETEALPVVSLQDVIGANPPPSLLIVLDQVTDPHNVGAILRSAAAFGAGAVIMTERNAPTTTGVLAKSASGALEHVPMIHVVNLSRSMDELRDAGYWIVGLAEEGKGDLGELDLSGRTALVLGAEGDGLRHLTRQKCDELARLPTGGAIGSLNVSNAAAVALYEARRQNKK